MKILVGLSGGVDSSFAAAHLKRNGHTVVGASVLMHDYTDISSAEKSAEEIGIPFAVIDARGRFENYVTDYFTESYCSGCTPNPCCRCNPFVKFESLRFYAVENGFDRFATGHYSSVESENGRFFIRCGRDETKDQSYVLWGLTQEQLSMLYLPLSEMKKEYVRAEAERLGLSSYQSADSQEICFIPDNDYQTFIRKRTGKDFPSGNFVDEDGKILGRHSGIINYTVGQRKGLGIALGAPVFVSEIRPETNEVVLVPSGGEYFTSCRLENLSFMKMSPEADTARGKIRTRYSKKAAEASAVFDDKGCTVTFDEPVRAVTKGQSGVFYDGNDILFGGIITSAEIKKAP